MTPAMFGSILLHMKNLEELRAEAIAKFAREAEQAEFIAAPDGQSQVVSIRVRPQEWHEVAVAATAMGLKPAEWVRYAVRYTLKNAAGGA